MAKKKWEAARNHLLKALEIDNGSVEVLAEVEKLNKMIPVEKRLGEQTLFSFLNKAFIFFKEVHVSTRGVTPVNVGKEVPIEENVSMNEEAIQKNNVVDEEIEASARKRVRSPTKKRLTFSPFPNEVPKTDEVEEDDIPICKFFLKDSECSRGKECPKLHISYKDIMKLALKK